MANIKHIKHLRSRAGFGMNFDEIKFAESMTIKQAVKDLFEASITEQPLDIVKGEPKYTMAMKGDQKARKMLARQQREQERQLNLAWINQMSSTKAQLREKMTLFWNNHFACRTKQGTYAQQLNNIQRTNALGNFKALTLEISKSPAMLQFLNNQQNLKGHPNENFARELMELFTISRGNYTEQDVKESARAFTGWSFDRTGNFRDRPFVHDDGQKTFLGKTGNFNGEDIINILLEKKETARFISNKLYKYLVNETPDPVHVNAMADVFYKADYEITPLLEFVFTADWFYAEKNIGNLVKSPVELIVGLNRQFDINYQRPEVMLQFQKVLGQVLFYPPNVAGWPGGRSWIDSSSLMYRMKIPSTILNAGLIDFTGKATPEDEAYLASQRKQQLNVIKRVQATADWDKFFKDIPKDTTRQQIAEFMLEPDLNKTVTDEMNNSGDLRSAVIQIVSTPEYQLC